MNHTTLAIVGMLAIVAALIGAVGIGIAVQSAVTKGPINTRLWKQCNKLFSRTEREE